MRGTPEAYIKAVKQEDTLYFISEKDSSEGVLYLGTKIIGGSSSIDFNNFSIDALKDVLISENLTDKSFLVYSVENQNWINADFDELCFVGATNKSSGVGGFVPAPEVGQTNLFLRSDGKWVSIATESSGTNQETDSLSIDIYNNQITLKNYGIKYYKYDSTIDDYVIQIVDDQNPWKIDLEPKVVEENGEFVLGWFESKLDKEIEKIEQQIIGISNLIGQKANSGFPSTGIFAELDSKANKNSVFTKSEVENLIQESMSSADHLKRVIIDSIEDIDINAADAQSYIYLISSGLEDEDNKYYEYLVIENQSGQRTIEKIGTWTVDLSNYAKKSDILINKVNLDNFQVIDGTLSLNKINVAQVEDLENILNQKVTMSQVDGKFVATSVFEKSVGDLNSLIQKNSEDIITLMDYLTWQDLNNN